MEKNKEKLIITCEVVDIPKDADMFEFQIIVLKKGLFSRVFKNWRKISYKKAVITNLSVEKYG